MLRAGGTRFEYMSFRKYMPIIKTIGKNAVRRNKTTQKGCTYKDLPDFQTL